MNISNAPIRLARPTRDLQTARRFWVDGIGLSVLWQSGPEVEGGHALLMVGAPGAAWHLELVEDVVAHGEGRRSPEDLLVLYLGTALTAALTERVIEYGGERVASRNPYWDHWGATFLDPDGYLLVLSHRTWS